MREYKEGRILKTANLLIKLSVEMVMGGLGLRGQDQLWDSEDIRDGGKNEVGSVR